MDPEHDGMFWNVLELLGDSEGSFNRYIDVTMEIQESISVGPFSRMQGSSGGFPELLCSFGDWLFHWVFDALVDITEDDQFRTGKLQAFQRADCKELQGQQCDIGVIICTGPMVSPPVE
jgi:hypothetical protein